MSKMNAREPSVSPPKDARKQWQAPRKKLNYYKCKQCRQDRQRCDEIPENRAWPGQRCHRCERYEYACSENVDSEGNPMPLGRSQVSPSRSPVPYSRSPAVPHHAISQSMHQESISTYADLSSTYDVYTSHPGTYPAYMAPHDVSGIPDLRSGSIHSLPTSESALAQSTADIPSIHFTWLHNCNFQGYVSGQITEEGRHSIRRLYGMISSRRRAIQAYEDRLLLDNSIYPLSGDYDQYNQQQHQQRLITQQTTGHYQPSYDLGDDKVDIYTATPLDRSYLSHSSYNPSSSRTSLSVANAQQLMTITTNLTEIERSGLRWKELITELRSEEVLLIDPFYSASFEHLIKHGSDEEFYNTRLHLSVLGSYARELCLRLSGIVNMIEELKATRAIMSPETRGYIAYNIDTRIEKVIPLSLASLDINDSPHSSLGQYDESDYRALEPSANVNLAYYH